MIFLSLGQGHPPRSSVPFLQLVLCCGISSNAQILSGSFSSTMRLLKSFLFPGAYCTGGLTGEVTICPSLSD